MDSRIATGRTLTERLDELEKIMEELRTEINEQEAKKKLKKCANPHCLNQYGLLPDWVPVAARHYDLATVHPYTMQPIQIRLCSYECREEFVREYADAS